MPPQFQGNECTTSMPTGILDEHDEVASEKIPEDVYKPDDRPPQIVWQNVGYFLILHAFAFYGIYLAFTSAKLATIVFGFLVFQLATFGVTAGAHRLWAHRAYKAKWQLKLILIVLQTVAHQNSVIKWSRDHRVHHKFQETNADPHNAKRGFIFSHIGWLYSRKHEEVSRKGRGIDLSDLHADPFVAFQNKYFYYLMPLACFILPTLFPMWMWNETFTNAHYLNMLRYVFSIHIASLVNSAAHLWGSKPYNKYINPAENRFVAYLTLGEGWHNYHHTFPWDYKTSELGKWNGTQTLIDMFAKIGWAYDLKTASDEMIKNRVVRTGDGSHAIWGWGDKDQTKEDYEAAVIYNKKEYKK